MNYDRQLSLVDYSLGTNDASSDHNDWMGSEKDPKKIKVKPIPGPTKRELLARRR